ncbi:MAG: amino acid ABC transporter substrate-binding protein [Desulfobacteraceae bacterium]|nr:amino acid ABC transporter substrate-binding protein [Desulfobacteraceae bacterium]
MIRFKKMLMGITFLLLGSFFHFSASAQSLVFNTQDFPPFSYKIKDRVCGPAVQIIEKVCEKIGVGCVFRLLPWRRAQQEVKEGTAHAMFVIGWNKARDEWLYFSPPIMQTEYGVFVNNSNPLEFRDIFDIKGYTVGVYGPSNTSRSLEKIKAKVGNITIDLQPDDESGFRKLDISRINAVFSNKDVGYAMIKKMKLNNLRYAGTYKSLNYYIGFSKQFNDKNQVTLFNAAFMELYRNGTIKKILSEHRMQIAVIE